MLVYRLNRVPDKLHVALLELLGIQLAEPVAGDDRRALPAGGAGGRAGRDPGRDDRGRHDAHGQRRVDRVPDERGLHDPAGAPDGLPRRARRRAQGRRRRRRRGAPEGRRPARLRQPPKVGDALYLGFDTSLARLLLRVDVDCSQARGAGVDPEDPPLRWEVSDEQSETGWREAEVLADLTGGFNYGTGAIELQLPSRHSPRTIAGQRAYWVRCRLDATTRSGAASAAYTHPPEIYAITAGADRRAHPGGALRAPPGRAARRERRHAGAALPAALRARARADAGRAPRGARGRRRRVGAVGAARVVRREQARRPRTTCSTPPTARSSSAPRSARPTAAGGSTAACRRSARCCA